MRNSRVYFLSGLAVTAVGILFIGATFALPHLVDPSTYNAYTPFWIFAVFGTPCAIAGIGLLRQAVRTMRKDWRLMKIGVKTEAVVTGVDKSPFSVNGDTGRLLVYRYTFNGRSLSGRSGPLFDLAEDKALIGRTVEILVDPDKPEDSTFSYM